MVEVILDLEVAHLLRPFMARRLQPFFFLALDDATLEWLRDDLTMSQVQHAASKLRRILFALLSLALILCGSELLSWIGLRAALGGWDVRARLRNLRESAGQERGGWLPEKGENPVQPEAQYALHPYLGFVLDAGFRAESRLETGGQEALDYGFLLSEPGIFHRPRAGRLTVAVMGGSVAMQMGSRGSGRLREGLSEALPTIDHVRVINLALPGYKQPQQLITLDYLLSLGARFDVVINLDGYNEIALPPVENVPRGIFPFFPRAWFFRASGFDTETRLAVAELTRLGRVRFDSARFFGRSPWRQSLTAGVVWRLLDLRLASILVAQERRLEEMASKASFAVTGPPREYPRKDLVYRDLAFAWVRSSILMNAACEGSDCVYFHFLQPNQYVPDSKKLTKTELKQAFDPNFRTRQHVVKGYPHLIEHGRRVSESGVSYQDLSQIFQSSTESDYADFCCHLTEKGEAKLVDAIVYTVARRLADRGSSG